MSVCSSVIIADGDRATLDLYQATLAHLGHRVAAACTSRRELADACAAHQPDLILVEIGMADMDAAEALAELKSVSAPVILVSDSPDDALLERPGCEHVMGYLVKPVQVGQLAAAIAVATHTFARLEASQQEAATLKQSLQERKVIERAKGILMKRAGLDEADAFRRLQKLACDKNQKLIHVAELIVTANEALETPRVRPLSATVARLHKSPAQKLASNGAAAARTMPEVARDVPEPVKQ